MSHFAVLVIGENVKQQLAPFQENNMGDCPKEYLQFNEDEDCDIDSETGKKGYWENPNAKWDWWEVGGRWSGFFQSTSGSKIDSGRKSEIDFASMYKKRYESAISDYEKLESLFGGAIPKLQRTWDEIRDDSTIENIDEKRKAYHAQPAVISLNKIKENRENRDVVYSIMGFMGSLDEFQVSKEEYADSLAKSRTSTFAVIKDGKWYQKGDMGWWGISSNEKGESEWQNEFSELINSLPDETLLTVVDCHI